MNIFKTDGIYKAENSEISYLRYKNRLHLCPFIYGEIAESKEFLNQNFKYSISIDRSIMDQAHAQMTIQSPSLSKKFVKQFFETGRYNEKIYKCVIMDEGNTSLRILTDIMHCICENHNNVAICQPGIQSQLDTLLVYEKKGLLSSITSTSNLGDLIFSIPITILSEYLATSNWIVFKTKEGSLLHYGDIYIEANDIKQYNKLSAKSIPLHPF